ncbi:MAG TPA: ATP-binding protein [Acidimicrobiales bacterium]|nr:ATP-binding protein [Acidimicrobiales bacterium]
MAPTLEDAGALLAEWRALRDELNIYRGSVLAVAQGDRHNPFGDQLMLAFVDAPAPDRSEVVLADGVLERIERHTIEFAHHAARLRAAGRSLRRGMLLYGPPGTGKTHTVRYLAGALEGRTTFIISGAALGLVQPICRLARELQPSMVVLEDVDLVALERNLPGQGSNPLLFGLMNEMDGVAADADIIFLLTTNRADLLEPALAARPGRVDLAIEIERPDAECRRRLVELYGLGLALPTPVVENIVERTDGVSAAFVKELLRRAALVAATAGGGDDDELAVTAAHVDQALDEMLRTGGALTRALLGAADEASPHDPNTPYQLPPGVRIPPGLDIRAFERAGIIRRGS